MKQARNISWTDVLDDVFTVNEGTENQQTFAMGKNQKAESFIYRLAHFEKDGFPVFLINEYGQNIKTTTYLSDEIRRDSSFQWAKEEADILHESLMQISLDFGGKRMLDLFQRQGGLLCLFENEANEKLLHHSFKKDAPRNEPVTVTKGDSSFVLGTALPDMPVILISSQKGKDFSTTSVLLHELTHQAESVSFFSGSPLFNEILQLEAARHPPVLQNIFHTLNKFIEKDLYETGQLNEELFARLHEEKFKDPEEFEKQVPLLNIFYNQIVYPALDAYLLDYKKTKTFLDSFMKKDLMSKTEKESFEKNQTKIKDAEKNLKNAAEKEKSTGKESQILKKHQADQTFLVQKMLPALTFRLKAQLESYSEFYRKKDKEYLAQNPTNNHFMEYVKKAAWSNSSEYRQYRASLTFQKDR